MNLKEEIQKSMRTESIDDKIADIADLVGEKEEIVRDRLKTLDFKQYIELVKSVRDTEMETAREILGLGMEEANEVDNTKYGIVRYPDTAISYIKNDGNGWEHIYDKSYGFKGPVDKADLKHAKKIAKEKIPSRMFKEQYSAGGTQSPSEMRASKSASAGATTQAPTAADKTKKAQAMQRLGKDNLGGATAQQAADAVSQAGQGKALTPIQRKAMAQQASSVDALAADPRTATQFRNLLNKLNK
tara:strand:+ start:1941 stop:2672 length:732 start_codon:yes stop_codon:yes gene_type:complete